MQFAIRAGSPPPGKPDTMSVPAAYLGILGASLEANRKKRGIVTEASFLELAAPHEAKRRNLKAERTGYDEQGGPWHTPKLE